LILSLYGLFETAFESEICRGLRMLYGASEKERYLTF